MLEMLHTKATICCPGAVLYFRIYALGMPALGVFFNFGNAGAQRERRHEAAAAVPSSTIAGILNVILNLFLPSSRAGWRRMAWRWRASFSQYVSAILVVWHMMRLE